MEYRINVQICDIILTYYTKEYNLKEGMCIFIDQKTNKSKAFSTTICEITEL